MLSTAQSATPMDLHRVVNPRLNGLNTSSDWLGILGLRGSMTKAHNLAHDPYPPRTPRTANRILHFQLRTCPAPPFPIRVMDFTHTW